jgi:hypothetical protein
MIIKVKMKTRTYIISVIFLLGCIASFEQQLPLLKKGMTKMQVDEILQDSGKWLGPIDTKEGIRNAWGYPTVYFGPIAKFDRKNLKRYILFFDHDIFTKYTKYGDPFLPDTFPSVFESHRRIRM